MSDYQGNEQNNDQAPARVDHAPAARVDFGPKDHQNVSVEVASMILTLWREKSPAQFGSYLAAVMTGEEPSTGTRGARGGRK